MRKPIRVFLDTEFSELTQQAVLISIGLSAENGHKFYAEHTDFNPLDLHPWVKENVLPLLSGNFTNAATAHTKPEMFCQGNLVEISRGLRRWFNQFGEKNSVEIWADVLAWDWVLFCEVFGGAFAIPEQVFWIPFDLSTGLKMKGIDPEIAREELGKVEWSHPGLKLQKHHALYDAELERSIYERLNW